MKYLLALILILSASTAEAQRIRDQSLTPQETMHQPDIINSGTQPLGGNWSNNFGVNNEGTGHSQGMPYNSQGYIPQQSRYFIDSYCDQNAQPLVRSQRLSNMTGCMEDMKNKACDAFRRLPPEARSSVDGATECMFSMEDIPYAETKSCGQFERDQLALVKKYWNNPETAYAIAFIPDMVVNPMIFCERR